MVYEVIDAVSMSSRRLVLLVTYVIVLYTASLRYEGRMHLELRRGGAGRAAIEFMASCRLEAQSEIRWCLSLIDAEVEVDAVA